MKVLIDECAPKELKTFFAKHGHKSLTVQEAGWAGKQNGELLKLAETDFDVLVTVDTNLSYQQNLEGQPNRSSDTPVFFQSPRTPPPVLSGLRFGPRENQARGNRASGQFCVRPQMHARCRKPENAGESDSETSLYYYRARYYDVDTGRFITEDPLTFNGGEDFYRYSKNNSINLVDPFGLGPGAPAIPFPRVLPYPIAAPWWAGPLGGFLGLLGGELVWPDAAGIDDARAIPRRKTPPPCDKKQKRL